MSSLTASEARPRLALTVADPVVQLDDVSVLYRVPHERISSFKEMAIRWMQRRIQYLDLWALKAVSFSVNRGEVFGIVGSNGAGKSTALRVVARVLTPTSGRVRVRGRVAPLLELGAGFDFELTGRENVYLNGALLGHSQKEMDRRLGRIVEFAGLSDFVDAPLRAYSTGMVARLGFAVATDVDADILIVDEVLSVGDEVFQRKCLDRIRSFREAGVTILLVSHDASTVRALCDRAAWLEHGVLRAIGPAREVVSEYQRGRHD